MHSVRHTESRAQSDKTSNKPRNRAAMGSGQLLYHNCAVVSLPKTSSAFSQGRIDQNDTKPHREQEIYRTVLAVQTYSTICTARSAQATLPATKRGENLFSTLSSKNSSSSGMVNSNSHVTSDPETGGTNLTTTASQKSERHTRAHKDTRAHAHHSHVKLYSYRSSDTKCYHSSDRSARGAQVLLCLSRANIIGGVAIL